MRLVTSAVDPALSEAFHIMPGFGNFGNRYFGTEFEHEYDDVGSQNQNQNQNAFHNNSLDMSSCAALKPVPEASSDSSSPPATKPLANGCAGALLLHVSSPFTVPEAPAALVNGSHSQASTPNGKH